MKAKALSCVALLLAPGLHAQTPNPRPPDPRPGQGGIGIVEAGQWTIDLNPTLGIYRQQINISRGSLLMEQSVFDLNWIASMGSNRSASPLVASNSASLLETSTQSAGSVSKLFRSGISVTPSLQLNRSSNNYSQLISANTSRSGIRVVLPILRNRGRAIVAARETAASLQLDATAYDLSQSASEALTSTAVAYWRYAGAIKELEIYAGSEERGQQFVENSRALASADIIPRVDVESAIANLASRAASRIGAEQRVLEARQALALAIGIAPGDMPLLGQPTDPFADGTDQPMLSTEPEKLREYIQLALSRRADYLAANVRGEESRVMLGHARNQLRPQLNAIVDFGYTGWSEGARFDRYLSPLVYNVHGPNAYAGIEYRFPRENRHARGQIMASEATVQQRDLRVFDLARNIASQVIVAASSLNTSVLQLRQAREAAASFRNALFGEQERLRQGVGSIFDLLQTEERYVSATTNEIYAQVNYSIAVANFRLATGTFLQPDQPVQAVGRDAFYFPLPR